MGLVFDMALSSADGRVSVFSRNVRAQARFIQPTSAI